jgi:hypothetical protein
VSTQDAIEIRAAKRRNLEWKAAREAEFAKKEAEFTTTHGEKLKKTTAILDAFERGDPESFAQALGAKDFNELQQSWIKRLADPNYMELRKLQLESEERRNKETQAAKDAEQAAAARQRTEIRQGYMRSLAEQCKASTNPLLREMHDDPAFLQDIYRIQEENWDDDAQKTVTLDEAIKMAIKGGKVTLEEWHKKNAERYSRVYGQPAAAAPPVAAAAPLKGGKKPAPKTAVVPSTSTAAAGAPLKPGDMTPQAWRKYANARLAEADD